MTQYPEYTPVSSLGRELGIMCAFIGACVVTMVIYLVIWRREYKFLMLCNFLFTLFFTLRVGYGGFSFYHSLIDLLYTMYTTFSAKLLTSFLDTPTQPNTLFPNPKTHLLRSY